MTKSYNHIKYFVDRSDDTVGVIGIGRVRYESHERSELDRKQNHPRFDYYGHDRVEFSSANGAQSLSLLARGKLDLLEHFEDPEDD